jgi:hypothetical protein
MSMTEMARVEQAVHDGLQNAYLLAAALVEVAEREGYWENTYMVAWRNERECGTHAVHIDSNNRHMCVMGHYMPDPDDALEDFRKRINRPRVWSVR